MKYRDPACLDRLAAEYVLGVLHGAARRRFQRLCEQREDVQAEVDAWRRRLHLLADSVVAMRPSPSVWLEIERRNAAPTRGSPAPPNVSWWESLLWWRSLAAFATVALVAILLPVEAPLSFTPAVGPPEPADIAVLQDADSQAMLVATASRSPWRPAVQYIGKVDVPDDRSL